MATLFVIVLILLLGRTLDRAYHAHRGKPSMFIGYVLFEIVLYAIVAIYIERTFGTIDVIAFNPHMAIALLELGLFVAAMARANFYRTLFRRSELIRFRAFADLLVFVVLTFILGTFSQPPHATVDTETSSTTHREAR